MKIGNKIIGFPNPAFVIAEVGVNYNNNLKIALKMIDQAKKAGADAVKFQTFVTDELVLKNSIKPKYQNNFSKKSYYDILKMLEPKFSDQEKIFKYCKKRKIIFLSTPYDQKSLNFLFTLGVPAIKISSSDITNHLFLEDIAKKKIPVILSTGLSTQKLVDDAFQIFKRNKSLKNLAILQTTSDYPAKNNEINLRVLNTYRQRYNVHIGLSDHTKDITASLGAVALGASVLEKHFTLNKKMNGPDQSSSLNYFELTDWINKIRDLEKLMGSEKKFVTKSENGNLSMRKNLVISPSLKGTIITKKIISTKRTKKGGILPIEKNTKKIFGKKLKKSIKRESAFSWDMV
jgi:N,N'-diacetyllegionaminate synthase